jgi:5'(3')-deoxyribonucleotidase
MDTQVKPRVLIDLDGVIRDFIEGLKKVYLKRYPDHQISEIVSRDLEHFFPIGEKINDFIFSDFFDEISKESPPYPGSIETLNKWEEEFEIVIVTSQYPHWRYPTFSWIGRYCLPTNEVHISFEKHRINGYALLDDFTENLESFAKTGRLAVCLDQPWNQAWEGPRVKSVDEYFQLIRAQIDSDLKINEGEVKNG